MPEPLFLDLPASLKTAPERLAFLVLALSVSCVLLSIALSQIFLGLSLVGALWLYLRQHKAIPAVRSIAWPLLCFFAWTVLAALASSDIRLGLGIVKKFFIFLLVILVPFLLRGAGRTLWTYHMLFAAAGISSLMGFVQYAMNPGRDLLNRIAGFMGQWMTYSGLQMIVLVALCAYGFCYGVRRRWWILPLGLLLAGSLYLSLTRNAWMGAAAGIAVILILKRPRALAAFLVVLLALILMGPANLRQRLRAGLDTSDKTTRGRIELMETSLRLIHDHPWFGVGPKNVNTEALRYRGTREFPDWLYQHMHNNFLQIAAERGLPGLLLWLWFMGRLAWDAIRTRRYAIFDSENHLEIEFVSIAALAAWTALLVAGLFEYNFGDSEVLTLFLFIMSAPYVYWNGAGDVQTSKTG